MCCQKVGICRALESTLIREQGLRRPNALSQMMFMVINESVQLETCDIRTKRARSWACCRAYLWSDTEQGLFIGSRCHVIDP